MDLPRIILLSKRKNVIMLKSENVDKTFNAGTVNEKAALQGGISSRSCKLRCDYL